LSKHKKDVKKLKYPKTIHILNLGDHRTPDYLAGTEVEELLWDDAGTRTIATYELVTTEKMRRTSIVETV
jgi:hypothetical protein